MKRVVVVMMALTLAACGDDGGSLTATPPKTAAALEQQVRSYVDNLFAKKITAADAYATMSERCKAAKPFSQYAGEFLMVSGMIESIYGKGAKAGKITVTDLTGDRATVRTEILTGNGDVATDGSDDLDEWVFEGGRWRMDSDCENA